MKIADEKSAIRGKYCGELTGKFSLADVNGHYAVVTFHSNEKREKQGFVITFTAVSPCKYYQNGVFLKVILQLTFSLCQDHVTQGIQLPYYYSEWACSQIGLFLDDSTSPKVLKDEPKDNWIPKNQAW